MSKWTENCCFSSRFGSVQIALLIIILTKLYLRKRVLILTKGAKDIRGNGLSFKEACLSGVKSDNLRLKQTLVCKRKENTLWIKKKRSERSTWCLAGMWGTTDGHGQIIRACKADGYTHFFAVRQNNRKSESFGRDYKIKTKNKTQRFVENSRSTTEGSWNNLQFCIHLSAIFFYTPCRLH